MRPTSKLSLSGYCCNLFLLFNVNKFRKLVLGHCREIRLISDVNLLSHFQVCIFYLVLRALDTVGMIFSFGFPFYFPLLSWLCDGLLLWIFHMPCQLTEGVHITVWQCHARNINLILSTSDSVWFAVYVLFILCTMFSGPFGLPYMHYCYSILELFTQPFLVILKLLYNWVCWPYLFLGIL